MSLCDFCHKSINGLLRAAAPNSFAKETHFVVEVDAFIHYSNMTVCNAK